jgi:hypothetical protein
MPLLAVVSIGSFGNREENFELMETSNIIEVFASLTLVEKIHTDCNVRKASYFSVIICQAAYV